MSNLKKIKGKSTCQYIAHMLTLTSIGLILVILSKYTINQILYFSIGYLQFILYVAIIFYTITSIAIILKTIFEINGNLNYANTTIREVLAFKQNENNV